MKSRIEEPSDLLSLARRGPITRDESRELAAWVEGSPEARVLSEAAGVFDRDSSAQLGDDALLARIAARAVELKIPAAPAPSRPRKRASVLLLAAALVVVVSAATASSARLRHGAAAMFASLGGRSASDATPAAPMTAAPAPAPSAAPEETTPTTPEVAPEPAVSPAQPAPSTRAAAAEKASALFGRANAKRLAGDEAGSLALYRELGEKFPGTPEAFMAEMSLGKMLLAKGDAAGALVHFRRYASSGGPLAVEAMWGQADALRRLGKTSDERRVLEKLLDSYPDSAYATAARKRLGSVSP
jgi:TolA-binding protein